MNILTPRKALNKAYLKQKINRHDMERFKTSLQKMLSDMNPDESEEYHKKLLRGQGCGKAKLKIKPTYHEKT